MITNTLHSVGLLWKGDQPDAETSTWQNATLTRDKHAPVWLEPTIPARERPQTHALDRAATEIGSQIVHRQQSNTAQKRCDLYAG